MDKTIEGALTAALLLIPYGVTQITTAIGPDAMNQQIVGLGAIAIGLFAIYIRANMKEQRVTGYVKKKVKDAKE